MSSIGKTVAFYTLGCKLNFSETSTIGRAFEEHGYARVDFDAGADVTVINTCSVTDNADKKCRKIVHQARRRSPAGRIIVVGCYAQLRPEEIAAIPGVDLVLGAAEKFKALQYLQKLETQGWAQVRASSVEAADFFAQAYSMGERTRTFLKVQDGCDYGCAFCTIPLARGKSRSDTVANMVKQARQIAAEGVREIVLTGVNIGAQALPFPALCRPRGHHPLADAACLHRGGCDRGLPGGNGGGFSRHLPDAQ